MSTYQVYLDDFYGERLIELPLASLAGAMVLNDVSVFVLEIGEVAPVYIKTDRIVEIWRTPDKGTPRLLMAGFIRAWRFYDENELHRCRLYVYSPDYLLAGRIVAYASGTSQASMTDYADDMLKAIVTDNLGGDATDTDRDITGLNFAVMNDKSDGPSITKSFAWRDMLRTLQDIATISAEAGTDLYFAVQPYEVNTTTIGFRFQTFTGQMGVDRGSDSDYSITFSPENHNLTDAFIEFDYSAEVNYIYAGGQGEESNRVIVEVENASREQVSPWNRREKFADARNESTTAGVTAKGNAELEAGAPVIRAGGILQDAPNSVFGVDWNLGDKVIVEYRGYIYDAIIKQVQVDYSAEAGEVIAGSFEIV